MDIIQLLPEHVANQIAAGEVVQRPASVVKELLENAIDAGADVIKLLVKDAGRTLVQVIDNGKGMSVTDARMSFERHATSKIRKTEDLFHLHTKGFRGEALASIAAVAQVELKTRQKEDEIGTKIAIEGSKILSQEPIATPPGTSIAVKNLFYNIPARRNFLKSDTQEIRHVIDELQRIALSHPEVTFFMYHNDNEVYHLPASNLKKRIVNIFGVKINEKLVPIEEQTDIVKISGFIAKPEFAKKKRGEQFFFVNNRFIRSNYFNHAVRMAFEGLVTGEQHPGFFLFLEVPSQSIDINIHPTKTEIKFDNENDLYAILYATIKHSLGQYNVAPVLDFNRDSVLDLPYQYKDKLPHKEPEIRVDRTYNPFQTNDKYSDFEKKTETWEALYTGLNEFETQATPNFQSHEQELESAMLFEQSDIKTQQLQNKYIVSTIKSGLVFIHQSRAHQRILYEAFLEKMNSGEVHSQQLLFPLQLHFEKSDILIIKELVEDLMACGFTFETIKEEYLIVNGLPPQLEETQVSGLFEEILESKQENYGKETFNYTEYLARLLAKNAAIKVGQILHEKAQEELVDNLFNCKEPGMSPDGKPCFTTLTLEEIDKRL
jgi:DNA mismatch repair protein MutL